MKKGQVIFIHGGDSFDSNESFYDFLRGLKYDPHAEPYKRWRDSVQDVFEAAGGEWLFLSMPNKMNADYEAWKIWFEKVTPYIEVENPTQIVAYSLGACFMMKYLIENTLPFTLDTLHLVAPSLDDGQLGSFVMDESRLATIGEQVGNIAVYHSKDDPICRYSDSEKIARLVSKAALHTFTDRGHFFQPEFPELLAEIEKV